MALNFERVQTYQRAFKNAVELVALSKEWPKWEQYGGLADQIRRASRGICANVAEGLGKFGYREQIRFLNIAVGSATEVRVWLEFAFAHGYISLEAKEHFLTEYSEITGMLLGLIRRRETAGQNSQPS